MKRYRDGLWNNKPFLYTMFMDEVRFYAKKNPIPQRDRLKKKEAKAIKNITDYTKSLYLFIKIFRSFQKEIKTSMMPVISLITARQF